MKQAAYVLTTRWQIEAPLDAVWESILHSERWPRWWPGLREVVELKPGDERRVGCVRRFVWKGRLPYTLTVEMAITHVEPPTLLESEASGELMGRGIWRLSPSADGTAVRYDWCVSTTKRWMNWLAPVARPVFRWNHDVVMRNGARGLKRLMNRRGDPLQEGLLEHPDGQNAEQECGQHHSRDAVDADR